MENEKLEKRLQRKCKIKQMTRSKVENRVKKRGRPPWLLPTRGLKMGKKNRKKKSKRGKRAGHKGKKSRKQERKI